MLEKTGHRYEGRGEIRKPRRACSSRQKGTEEGSTISHRHRKQSVRQTRLFIYTQIHRGEEEAFASALIVSDCRG